MSKDKLAKSCDILRLFEKGGFEAYIVGGTVRDLAMGSPFGDVDIVTSAKPMDIASLFPEAKKVGHDPLCTFVIPQDGWTVEITPLQGEVLSEDLSRRDFTINAMALNRFGDLYDPFGGMEDLVNKVLRFTGSPRERIEEDPVRCIRLFRFASTLREFEVSHSSMDAVRESLSLFKDVPLERIGKEIYKALRGSPFTFLKLLEDTGFLASTLPCVYALRGVPQDPQFHPEGDVYEHTKLCLKYAEKITKRCDVRAAALFHDIAKPYTMKEDEERLRFIDHEKKRGALAKEIMGQWAWPAYFVKKVSALVRWHMVPLISTAPKRIPRLYLEYGKVWLDGLFLLSYIDISSSNRDYSKWVENRQIALSCLFKLSDDEKLISGRDVMDILKIEEGPEVGRIIFEIYEMMAKGDIKSREEAIDYLKKLNEN